ncbi:hypothetical protein J6590_017359 [Homalodisca vitripennis]|nr:hypothetical protein J6590_017359 [Homalodisca vitripennis]
MYVLEGKRYSSATAALDAYVLRWERLHGNISVPGYSVHNQRDIRRAVRTIWDSLGIEVHSIRETRGTNLIHPTMTARHRSSV